MRMRCLAARAEAACIGDPPLALQAKSVLACGMRQRAVGGGVRAVQHGAVAFVEQHVVAGTSLRRIHGGLYALDLQADPAGLGFNGVERGEQE
ncbi:hypothetical protein G6F60_014738 [Rhizopus arrhizus]|nr:hypothetical protein G6F60_014738 [Rhizopus arrhizus]